jgi:hypothetical protein
VAIARRPLLCFVLLHVFSPLVGFGIRFDSTPSPRALTGPGKRVQPLRRPSTSILVHSCAVSSGCWVRRQGGEGVRRDRAVERSFRDALQVLSRRDTTFPLLYDKSKLVRADVGPPKNARFGFSSPPRPRALRARARPTVKIFVVATFARTPRTIPPRRPRISPPR